MNHYGKSWADLRRSHGAVEAPVWKKALGGICLLFGIWVLTALAFCL